LAAPGRVSGRVSFQRAQVAARATGLDALGVNWIEYPADVARFMGIARRLLIGGQSTNGIRNPRLEGGSAGAPGTLPTNVARTGGTDVTQTLAFSAAQGLACMDVGLAGTTGSTDSVYFFEAPNIIPAAPGGIFTVSMLLALTAGDLTNISSIQLRWTWVDATPANLTTFVGPDIKAALTSGLLRFTATTAAAPALTAWVRPSIIVSYSSGVAINATLRMAAPQVEAASFASTPILPAVGTPAASTRGADLVSAPLSSLGIGANGACTLLWSGMIPQNAGAATQTILQVDSGSANRYILRNQGASIVLLRVTAGVSGLVTVGTMTAGTPFSAGMSIDGLGGARACFNGGAVVGVAGGPTSGLNTLRIGNDNVNATPLCGEVSGVKALPVAVSDAELVRRVLGMAA
jgi:hypothetical protein